MTASGDGTAHVWQAAVLPESLGGENPKFGIFHCRGLCNKFFERNVKTILIIPGSEQKRFKIIISADTYWKNVCDKSGVLLFLITFEQIYIFKIPLTSFIKWTTGLT